MECATYMCEGMVIEILRRLPEKSVQRFMVVCRLWYSIITSPQLRLLTKPKFLVHTADRGFYTLVEEENHHRRLVSETDFCSFGGATKVIVGSDNGLICIDITKHVIICNPFIRKHVVVVAPAEHDFVFKCASGFGGTTSGGDYKYVKLVRRYFDCSRGKAVDIYSLKAGTWRRKHLVWEITPPLCKSEEFYEYTCALVRGRLHWMGTCQTEILPFELEEEVFENKIMVPGVSIRGLDPYCHNVNVDVTLTVIRESLAVMVHEMQEGKFSTVCVWVMKEYGDVNSWTKLCNIVFDQLFGFGRNMVHLMNDGELLLGLHLFRDQLKLVTHNTKKMETCDFGGDGSLSSSLTAGRETTGFTYKESQVWLGDEDAADSKQWIPFIQEDQHA